MKIGLFGGTFDPIHTGHLLLADVALGDAGLDQILFVPAAAPPHKPVGPKTSAGDRVQMVRLAVEGHPGFRMTDLELRRPGASYTVDTLVELKDSGEWRGAEWFLLIGADMLLDLTNWKDPDEIVRNAGLLVMKRPGFDIRRAEKKFLKNALQINAPEIGISSTEIRKRIRDGKSIRYWVPESVEAFIRERGLYRT
jgi:nicotinate-nucleotide adenylyltransferase